MPTASMPSLSPGDLVAVRLSPSLAWRDLVERVWAAGSALFPVDHRLPRPEADDLVRLCRPTFELDEAGWHSGEGGIEASERVAAVVATSGTAGAPKLVQLDRRAIEAAVNGSARALGAGARDEWLSCLPLGHIGGLLVLLRSVLLGASVRVQARFDPREIAATRGPSFVSLVPTMLLRLLEAGADLSHYRAILCGGDRLDPSLLRRAVDAGANVVQTYGLTESCGGVVYDGRPLPGVEIRLGEGDEVQLRGPTLMLGYRFGSDATADARAPGGWLRTGDAGALEGDLLMVHGRLDDAILTGGEKIWPEEVEQALRDHPDVAEIAVVARPDLERGSRVVAFVVPRDRATPPTLDELRSHAADRIGRHRAPRELVVVDELPRTELGKLRRSTLEGSDPPAPV